MAKESITANKELIVTEIIILINGYITYSDCLHIITQKYTIKDKTFSTYWKLANERTKQRQHDTQITIIDNHTNSQLKRADGLIASREELLQVLTKIVRDEVLQAERPSSVVQAIAKICEIEGYNKPTDVEGTINVPIISWANDNT